MLHHDKRQSAIHRPQSGGLAAALSCPHRARNFPYLLHGEIFNQFPSKWPTISDGPRQNVALRTHIGKSTSAPFTYHLTAKHAFRQYRKFIPAVTLRP